MDRVFVHPEAVARLTGASRAEFDVLLKRFEYALDNINFCETVRGKPRQKSGRGGVRGALYSPRDQLFFILTYYHLHPTQSAIAAFYGLTPQWASLWIKFLTPIAEEALGRKLQVPARMALRIDEWIAREPLVLLMTDARNSALQPFYRERKRPGPKPGLASFRNYHY